MAKKRDKFRLNGNGDDAYFIFTRHELNQTRKQVVASHEKLDMDLLAPKRRVRVERK